MPTIRPASPAARRSNAAKRRARGFSLSVPVVGQVTLPPAEQLVFYGMLGLVAAVNVIDWPVALAIGVGAAVAARHVNRRPASGPAKSIRSPSEAEPVTKQTTPPQSTDDPTPKKDRPTATRSAVKTTRT